MYIPEHREKKNITTDATTTLKNAGDHCSASPEYDPQPSGTARA
jgi:hypothetical protein